VEPVFFSRRDYITLETALAAWLNTANEHCRDDVPIRSNSVSLRGATVQQVAQIIRVHQMTALKTSVLKGALLRVLSEHIRTIPSELQLSLIRVFLEDVSSVCNVEVRGKCVNCKLLHFVKCIRL